MTHRVSQLPAAPPEPDRPRRARVRAAWTQYSLWLIAGVALLGALKIAQQAVVPVLFAVFVTLLLSPAVEAFARWRVPRVVAATLLVVALMALVAAGLSATWQPARDWLETAPATMRKLETKIRPMTRFIAKVESVSTQAGRMAEPASKSNDEPTSVALESKGLVESTQDWIITIVSMLFLTLFLLATDLANVGRNGNPDAPWGRFGQVFERVRSELGRYFAAVTFSNSILGVGTALTMAWLDMPNPLLWGVIAFLFNFIPYAGSATTLTLLAVVALVSFDGVGKAMSVAGTYLFLATLEGQVLQPVLVGRRIDISPPLVLLGLWFGGWLWGVAGVALATPILVSVKVAMQEVSRSERDAGAEERAETVRTRASEWLRRNASRYRRGRPMVP
ncbi:MAG: AI-2E family transporter [Steroidobacteraceae bacterium]